MTTRTMKRRRPATPLTRDRVLQTALALADQGGLESLSMRKLGQELGVEAMALYYHFANREEIVDGIVDLVFAEVDLPATDGDWKPAMRRRALSLRDALLRHRWAIGMMEARAIPGRRTCAITTRWSAAFAPPGSTWRWSRTPTRSWTPTSTASR